MQAQICVQCFISGKVHGVWFRASAQQQAGKLGVTGWARNLPDGRVEVMACGDREAIDAMLVWLKKGPELAVVSDLVHAEVPWKAFDRFAIL